MPFSARSLVPSICKFTRAPVPIGLNLALFSFSPLPSPLSLALASLAGFRMAASVFPMIDSGVHCYGFSPLDLSSGPSLPYTAVSVVFMSVVVCSGSVELTRSLALGRYGWMMLFLLYLILSYVVVVLYNLQVNLVFFFCSSFFVVVVVTDVSAVVVVVVAQVAALA